MVIQRVYNSAGLPAFVLVTKNERLGEDSPKELVYPASSAFDRLWLRGEEPPAPIVATPADTG